MPAKKPLTKKPIKTAGTGKSAALSQWLFKWPAKFALLSFGLMLATLALILLSAFSKSQTVIEITMLASIAASFIITIKWAIRKAGDALLSRRDLLYVNVSFTLISAAITALAIFGALSVSMDAVIAYQYMLLMTAPVLYLLLVSFGLLLGLYIMGLIVFKFIAIYKYAKANLVPKWKILLSIPTGITFLGWPAFIAESDKKTASAISNKSGWLDGLVDFIISKPIFGGMALVLAAILDGFTDPVAIAGTVAALVVFFAFVKIYGLKKLTSQMPGMLSTAAIILNIASITVMAMTLFFSTPATQPVTMIAEFEQAELTEQLPAAEGPNPKTESQ